MSSIGPQLPSHLSKRKRTPDKASSPPSKYRRGDAATRNEEEINLDDSDDDDYGPKAPSAPKPSIGPALPPSNGDEIDLDDSDDDYGPSAPGPQKPTLRPSLPPSNKDEIGLDSDSDSDSGPKPPAQSIGPTPPARAIGPAPPAEDSSSDSDDDYGPALPSSATAKRSIGPQLPPSEAAPQRDEWMLAPPTSSSYTERDPTRMRNRKFASKSSSSAPNTISSIWTETPEEKLKRLQNSVLGREDPAGGAAAQGPVRSREEEERQQRIAKSIEAKRGKSLYDEHQAKRHRPGEKVEEEDDPSKRGFDKEKDMALGGKIGTSQRRELMNKAANFGGRFQKGSFL